VVAVSRDSWTELDAAVAEADAVIPVAGVNRADDAELVDGNTGLAEDVARAVSASGRPVRIVYANSIQSGNETPYGVGKQQAAGVLARAAAATGGTLVDVRLPNLFGEHGRPGYNSFVATFIDAVVAGAEPDIVDRPIGLLHVQRAAQALIDALDEDEVTPLVTETSVGEVWNHLRRFHDTYLPSGDLPELADDLALDLFNSYRAALFPSRYPISLTPRSDQRGRLVETVRNHGSGGQTFVSTTVPGVTRGEHYHLRKIERFVVLEGEATIELRRMFSDEVITFAVSGESPSAIDMPTMWSHNITNTGDTTLTTLFWTDSLFDPDNPDTIPEPVRGQTQEQR
jgi:UDP-2-acetamido-2,6-beta-L-arabino-hexul-4-ose reductase